VFRCTRHYGSALYSSVAESLGRIVKRIVRRGAGRWIQVEWQPCFPLPLAMKCRVDGSVHKIDYSMAYVGTIKTHTTCRNKLGLGFVVTDCVYILHRLRVILDLDLDNQSINGKHK
jgi:hypothetical protein